MEKWVEQWSVYRKALYFDHQGQWDKAHELVQDLKGNEAAWIHAYLHRKEGDDWNAGYWYKLAGKSPHRGTLAEEWEDLWRHFSR